MKLLLTIFVTSLVGTCLSLPRAQRSEVMSPPRAACVSSQIIAVNLLKDAIEKEGNNVFSPLGISSILAILAEGARGETYDEFKAALNYPEDRQQLRESFKEVLESLYQKNLSKTPSFRTWFYVYRNNSARDEYKQILHDYYLVDVKDVEMNKPLTRADTSSSAMTSTTPANNSKDINGFEALKKSQPLESGPEEKKDASKFDQVVEDKQYVEVPVIKEEMAKEEMIKEEMAKEQNAKEEMVKEEMAKEEKAKEEVTIELRIKEDKMPEEEMMKEDIPKEQMPKEEMMKEEMMKEEMMKEEMMKEEMMKEDVPKEEMAKEEMPMEEMPMKEMPKEEMIQNDVPEQLITQNKSEDMMPLEKEMEKEKMSELDKVIEEKPIQMKAEKEAEKEQNSADLNMEDNETVKDEEKIDVLRKTTETALPAEEKKSNEPEKITIPLKKLEDLEIMQALESHFVAKRFSEPRSLFMPDDVASALSANSIIGQEKPATTKMLLFNGLYYRGNWRHPFQELRSSEDDVFYVTPEKTIPVTMMRTRGNFRTAKLEDLNSQVIELPYEDDRYVLYLIVPNERDGLKNAIQALTPEIFEYIPAHLSSSAISLCLPKFCSEQTNRAESVLQRLGLKMIFTKSADLSALSDMKDLFVEGVVQHVNVKVDEGATRENALTAIAQSRSAVEEVEEQKIVVDRPFLYYIIDKKTNVVIVAGKVAQPKTESSFNMEM